MTVRPDGETVWAWVSFPARPTIDMDRLAGGLGEHPALRMAIGEPGAGLAGFRASHHEALRAREVAEIGNRSEQRLYQHSDVALAGLLIERRDDVRIWVRRVLGDLALADESMNRRRETLQIFLQTNGSYSDAATRMHVHKNTVHYRARKAKEIIGHPITDLRLSIEVALLACDQLAVATETPSASRSAKKVGAGRPR